MSNSKTFDKSNEKLMRLTQNRDKFAHEQDARTSK